MINDLLCKGIEFSVSKKDFSKTEVKTKFVSMFLLQKQIDLSHLRIRLTILKIQRICCLYPMKINHILCTSKILTDLCLVKQKAKTKNIFVKEDCNV